VSDDPTFEIAPDPCCRVVTVPIDGALSKRQVAAQNIAAATLFPLSIFAIDPAFFAPFSLVLMCFVAVLGAGPVLAVCWRRPRMLVRLHGRFNGTAGVQAMQFGADGIVAVRPLTKSHIGGLLVRVLRGSFGAILIELPTARLIVPDHGLPPAIAKAAFNAQLNKWRDA